MGDYGARSAAVERGTRGGPVPPRRLPCEACRPGGAPDLSRARMRAARPGDDDGIARPGLPRVPASSRDPAPALPCGAARATGRAAPVRRDRRAASAIAALRGRSPVSRRRTGDWPRLLHRDTPCGACNRPCRGAAQAIGRAASPDASPDATVGPLPQSHAEPRTGRPGPQTA